MVWLNRSPIPVGRRGVISSFKWFLHAFATRWGRGVGRYPVTTPPPPALPQPPFVFPSWSMDISFKDDVTVIFVLGVSFIDSKHEVHICLLPIEYHSVCPSTELGPPTPSPASECALCTPLNLKGSGHTRLRVRGCRVGESQLGRLEKSLELCILCGSKNKCPLQIHLIGSVRLWTSKWTLWLH